MMRLALLALLAVTVLPGEVQDTPTGKVWVEMVAAGPDQPKEGVGRGWIEAPPERVFRALTDYAHWHEFMPFLEESGAQPQPDGSVTGTHRMSLPGLLGERRYRVRLTQKIDTAPGGRTWRIIWTYLPGSGNVKDHHGSWTLTAAGPGRTLAILRLYTAPGGATPRWAVDRGTSETVPWIFHGLRQHVRRGRYDG
ncbi:MAG TPA: SRPBCC family protein [Thermoanaerobaculia bacterium]|nr:SRPBCC family protein [Thermoanaerobaculia bacterium]